MTVSYKSLSWAFEIRDLMFKPRYPFFVNLYLNTCTIKDIKQLRRRYGKPRRYTLNNVLEKFGYVNVTNLITNITVFKKEVGEGGRRADVDQEHIVLVPKPKTQSQPSNKSGGDENHDFRTKNCTHN